MTIPLAGGEIAWNVARRSAVRPAGKRNLRGAPGKSLCEKVAKKNARGELEEEKRGETGGMKRRATEKMGGWMDEWVGE